MFELLVGLLIGGSLLLIARRRRARAIVPQLDIRLHVATPASAELVDLIRKVSMDTMLDARRRDLLR